MLGSGSKEADEMGGVRSRQGDQQTEEGSDGVGRGSQGVETTLGLQACQ